LAKHAPKKELSSLNKQRWHIELDLRNIKTTLGMETLSCKNMVMNEKEMLVYFLAYESYSLGNGTSGTAVIVTATVTEF